MRKLLWSLLKKLIPGPWTLALLITGFWMAFWAWVIIHYFIYS